MSLALQTLWWDGKGDWNRAHQCAQQDEGTTGSIVHAYLHRKEGDMRNAGGWYSRAGREPATVPLEQEWRSLADEMLTLEAVEGARAAMDGFMAAFNARDANAIRTRWFHFPHVRFHSGTAPMIQRREGHHNPVWNSDGQSAGWAARRGLLDVIDGARRCISGGFTRFRDRSAIGSYRSLQISDVQGRTLGDPGTFRLGGVSPQQRLTSQWVSGL
jgi:hypothetical protein